MRAVRFAMVAVAVVTAACSFAPSPRVPATVVELPPAFEEAEATEPYEPLRWWEDYGDPTLNRLVETALEANTDLAASVARLEEVRNRYRIARSPLFPTANASGEASEQSTPANVGFGGQFGEGDGEQPEAPETPEFFAADRFEFTTYTAALTFSYELDLWGRLRNDAKGGYRDFLATASDLETTRIQVIAATISNYLEILEVDRVLSRTVEIADVLEERDELTEDRYRRGLVTSFELYSIRQQFRNAQAAVPVLESRLQEARGRLAILLGRYAGRIDDLLADAGRLDPDPGPLSPDLPASLLVQRPDVRAAALRLEAARYRIGARRADLLPAFSLTETVGLQAGDPEDLFDTDQYFTSFAASLLAPIFQGGRLRANLGVAHAIYQQQAAAYAQLVLTAFKEVESALYELEKQRERVALVRAQVESATASVDLQVRRFDRGIGDYLAYLDARRDLENAGIGLHLAERQLAEGRLAVHRALGGAWVEGEGAAQRAVERFLRDARTLEKSEAATRTALGEATR